MIFKLEKNVLLFPRPELADEDGLLAVGGDLSTARLNLAYSLGIFPFVLFPEKVKGSKSMRKFLKSEVYTVTENQAFEQVIKSCASVERKDQDGTWIVSEMQEAYLNLHREGVAHSIEVWRDKELVGGLYGVKTGNVFCGESMFSTAANASKTALIWLCKHKHYSLIDCQFHTEHLESMGAEYISREEYMRVLAESC